MDSPVKHGILWKKGTRMFQWSSRYFTLKGPILSYKLKQDESEPRGEFDLCPGCIVTDIEEDYIGFQGKRVYMFWVVWPQDKNTKDSILGGGNVSSGYESPDEHYDANQSMSSITSISSHRKKLVKDLKRIVSIESKEHKSVKDKAEEQANLHASHDKQVTFGMKVAAAVTGGVVIGASTAGVGLLPYVVVVGTALAAGAVGAVGGVALVGKSRHPSDSRMILASDVKDDAKEWKAAIEHQISIVERKRRTSLPSDINPFTIMSILEINRIGGVWRKMKTLEGVRVLERTNPPGGVRCRRAQVVIKNPPVDSFLALMESPSPLKPSSSDIEGRIKVLKAIDDHIDIIQLTVKKRNTYGLFASNNDGFQIDVILNRFWKYDDDGVYLITYTSTGQTQFSSAGSKLVPSTSSTLDINIVMTISSRKDHNDFEDDVHESLVSCTCQLAENGWGRKQLEDFMDVLLQQIIDLRSYFTLNAFAPFCPGQDIEPKFIHKNAYSQVKLGRDTKLPHPVFVTKEEPEVSVLKKTNLRRSFSSDESKTIAIALQTVSSFSAKEKFSTTDSITPRRRSLFGRSKPVEVVSKELKRPQELHVQVVVGQNHETILQIQDDKKRIAFASEVKGKVASLEYEIKRQQKRQDAKAKQTTVSNSSGLIEEQDNLVEKKQQLQAHKETYRILTGKNYDEETRGRLRGLRRFAKSLRKSSSNKDISSPKRDAHPLINTDEETHSSSKDYRYMPRRVPRRWEFIGGHVNLITPEAFSAIFSAILILTCFVATSILESYLSAISPYLPFF